MSKVWRMWGLTRDGPAEHVSRDHILRRERGKDFFSTGHKQDWHPSRMSGLMRDRPANHVSPDQMIRREREQETIFS